MVVMRFVTWFRAVIHEIGVTHGAMMAGGFMVTLSLAVARRQIGLVRISRGWLGCCRALVKRHFLSRCLDVVFRIKCVAKID